MAQKSLKIKIKIKTEENILAQMCETGGHYTVC